MNLIKQLSELIEPQSLLELTDQTQRLINPFGEQSGATLLLRPSSTDELARIVRFCAAHAQALIPLGGASGLSGATKRLGDEWYLSTERMQEISNLDLTNRSVCVQPGVILSRLQQAASQAGLSFPVDFGARDSATLGGMLATNAGGEKAFRFGMTREHVLGLEVVLADGRVLDLMSNVRKDNTGPDLKQLFIGSEGTLGIISRVCLRLTEPEPFSQSALLALDNFSQVLALKSRLSGSLGSHLSAFEYMDAAYLEAVLSQDRHQRPFDDQHAHYVLVESTSLGMDDECFESALGEAWEAGLLMDVVLSQNETQAGQLWAIRNDIESMHESQGYSVPFDVSIPISSIERFVSALHAKLQAHETSLRLLVWGHLGDNNLHLNIGSRNHACLNKQTVGDLVYNTVAQHQGSISAEHGIGYDKLPWLDLTRSATALQINRQIKTLLDPQNLLNPGKVYPD